MAQDQANLGGIVRRDGVCRPQGRQTRRLLRGFGRAAYRAGERQMDPGGYYERRLWLRRAASAGNLP